MTERERFNQLLQECGLEGTDPADPRHLCLQQGFSVGYAKGHSDGLVEGDECRRRMVYDAIMPPPPPCG